MSSKTIVITGATRGIGRVMLEEFHKLGHKIIACGRSQKHVDEINETYSENVYVESVDTTDPIAVENWATAGIEKLGVPDLLLNNAALMNRMAPVWEQSADEFSQIVDVNIKGVQNVLRSFTPAMIQRGSGIICNLSSGWGTSTSPNVGPYCATKYAIEGLSKAMAQELPNGMASIPLSPGVINTDMLQSCWGESASSYPSTDEWAKTAIPYILSLGPELNGQSLRVPQ